MAARATGTRPRRARRVPRARRAGARRRAVAQGRRSIAEPPATCRALCLSRVVRAPGVGRLPSGSAFARTGGRGEPRRSLVRTHALRCRSSSARRGRAPSGARPAEASVPPVPIHDCTLSSRPAAWSCSISRRGPDRAEEPPTWPNKPEDPRRAAAESRELVNGPYLSPFAGRPIRGRIMPRNPAPALAPRSNRGQTLVER